MKNGVTQRGKTWSYVVRVPDPVTGKTKPRWVGGFATAKEAKAARSRAVTAMANGTHVEPTRMTVREYFVDRWLPAAELTVKASTLRGYRSHVETHLVPRIGGLRLQALTGDQLSALYVSLLTDGRDRGNGGLSPATVRRIHSTVRKALNDAVRWGLLVRNPATAANVPAEPRPGERDMKTWTAAELAAFLRHVDGDRLAPMWHVFASTGMRRGEVIGLRWSDVDLEAGRAAIQHTLVSVGYRIETSSPKTARGRRSVALDRATVARLRSWKAAQAAERLAWGPGWTDTGLVFSREDGTPIHPDRVTKLFDQHVARLEGVPRIRLHDLRHTWATLALQAGVHPKVVSERLGHATIAFTLDVYTHAVPQMQEDAAELVARLVAGR